jgi:hypothetical protein
MDWTDYTLIAGWLVLSGVMTCMGMFMLLSTKYRNRVTEQWFRSENEKDREGHRFTVRYIVGPLYVLMGLGFIATGLYFWNPL